MKIEGRRTIIERVDVDVDARAFLDKIYAETIPVGLNYLSEHDGYWYKEDGFDYHKREDLYSKERLATPEELELNKAFKLVREFIKNNGL